MIEITCTGAEMVRLNDLEDFQGNLKSLTQNKVDKLLTAMKQDGFSYPFFYWQDEGGTKFVFDGHQRQRVLEYAKSKGVQVPDKFPACKVEAKDKHDAARKLLAFNERYGTIEGEGLYEFMHEYDLSMEEISGMELDDINMDAFEVGYFGEPETDDVPDVEEEPVSKRGAVYQVGKHRVMCGDSTEKADMDTLMAGHEIDIVFTDPPYGMSLDADWSEAKAKIFAKEKGIREGKKYKNVQGDHDDFTPDLIYAALNIPAKERFIWGADYFAEFIKNKNNGSWIVWDKRLEESADKMYGSCFELCWSEQKHKREIARVKWAGVFGVEQEFDKKRQHPTQKPTDLVLWFLERWGKGQKIVADIFLGSGSTLIACEKTNRACYGMEIDPHYVDVIRKRWAEYVHGEGCDWQGLTPEIGDGD